VFNLGGPEMSKYCKDCKYSKNCGDQLYFCYRKDEKEINLVTGTIMVKVVSCRDERYSKDKLSCGADAKFFEPKVELKVEIKVKK
jgi:hypothetical protein